MPSWFQKWRVEIDAEKDRSKAAADVAAKAKAEARTEAVTTRADREAMASDGLTEAEQQDVVANNKAAAAATGVSHVSDSEDKPVRPAVSDSEDKPAAAIRFPIGRRCLVPGTKKNTLVPAVIEDLSLKHHCWVVLDGNTKRLTVQKLKIQDVETSPLSTSPLSTSPLPPRPKKRRLTKMRLKQKKPSVRRHLCGLMRPMYLGAR